MSRAKELPASAPEFATAAEHFRRLADQLARYPAFTTPRKSRARQEAADHSLDGAWGEPSTVLLHEPGARVALIADHMRALAAVTDAPGTVLAVSSLVRPALEGLATLWWLYDPEASPRERVRRYETVRLASLVEQYAVIRGFPEARSTAEIEGLIDDVRASATVHGFNFVAGKPRYSDRLGVHYLDKRMPSDAQLIRALLDAEGFGWSGYIHRMTSAVIHGHTHALVPHIVDRAPGVAPSVSAVTLGTSLNYYAILTGGVVLGSNLVMQRLMDHFGWSRGPWNQASQPALVEWRDWLAPGEFERPQVPWIAPPPSSSRRRRASRSAR
jgi:hypothetical protein